MSLKSLYFLHFQSAFERDFADMSYNRHMSKTVYLLKSEADLALKKHIKSGRTDSSYLLRIPGRKDRILNLYVQNGVLRQRVRYRNSIEVHPEDKILKVAFGLIVFLIIIYNIF